MNNKNQKRKSKPSGCEYRKAKKAREEENKKLGSFMLNYLKEKNKSTENSNKRTVNVADRALPQRSSDIAEEASDIVHGEIDCTLSRDEGSNSINRYDTDTSFKKSIENDSPVSFETASSEEEQHDELASSNLTDCEDREKPELIEGEVNEDDDEVREHRKDRSGSK